MSKATPGPWSIKAEFENECVVFGGDRMICECYEDGEEQTDEDRANARLIAAAPDLLAACEAAWNCIAELSPTQARVETAQMLQAAIAKAKSCPA